MRRTTAVLLVATLALAGCTDDGGRDVAEPTDADEAASLPFPVCDPDEPRTEAAPAQYDDDATLPTEAQVDEVHEWARGQEGFVELWVDRAGHDGWVTIGSTDEADARQAAIDERFGDLAVVAVEVDSTLAELEDLMARAQALPEFAGGSLDPSRSRIELWVGVLDEEHVAPFADLPADRVCIEGLAPEDAVEDGPQPSEGDGWRLLADELTGEAYRTRIATTEEQYAALWAESGVTAERPEVDLDAEVVVWFGAVYGSSCPIRMDDVVVADDLVHGAFVVPGNPGACTDDANPRAFVVALSRDRLPSGPFAVQLDADDPPPGAPEERTEVDVDLSRPGSTIPG